MTFRARKGYTVCRSMKLYSQIFALLFGHLSRIPLRKCFFGRAGSVTKYIYQFARILAFCFLGEVLHAVLPLPIPASIYGLLALLAALRFGLVRLEQVREVGAFLTGIFPLLFVPAAAGVMELWTEMGEMLLPIVIAIVPITALVLAAAGRTTQALVKRGEAKKHGAAE